MEVDRHVDADAFLGHARRFLLEHEAEHNLILGLSLTTMSSDEPGFVHELRRKLPRYHWRPLAGIRAGEALAEVDDDYDFVFIDTPPSLGLLTINALTASHKVIVPVQCEYLSMRGLVQLQNTLAMIRENLNPGGQAVVVLCTSARSALSSAPPPPPSSSRFPRPSPAGRPSRRSRPGLCAGRPGGSARLCRPGRRR